MVRLTNCGPGLIKQMAWRCRRGWMMVSWGLRKQFHPSCPTWRNKGLRAPRKAHFKDIFVMFHFILHTNVYLHTKVAIWVLENVTKLAIVRKWGLLLTPALLFRVWSFLENVPIKFSPPLFILYIWWLPSGLNLKCYTYYKAFSEKSSVRRANHNKPKRLPMKINFFSALGYSKVETSNKAIWQPTWRWEGDRLEGRDYPIYLFLFLPTSSNWVLRQLRPTSSN